MPRGVAIPRIRQQLFAAAERVMLRDGPGKLSGRAVTGEAGVATGSLYAHFTDFDDFLAAYAVDRAFLISAAAAGLPERAGTGSVTGNLCDAVLATPLVSLLALGRLLAARPALSERVRETLGDRTAGLDAIESAATTYLADEQRLGRVVATAEPESAALALVGALHRIVLTADAGTDVSAHIRHIVTTLANGFTETSPRP